MRRVLNHSIRIVPVPMSTDNHPYAMAIQETLQFYEQKEKRKE